MSREWGIGIAGAGVIGRLHAGAIGQVDHAVVRAVSDPVEEAGRALAGANGAAWHANYEEMLARPDVDVVILGTPSGLHAEQAALAAGAGKHIVTEKPMATTVADIDRMIAACREAGVTLAVIFQNRFSRETRLLKRAIEAGLIGRPILGNAFVHWRRTAEYYAASGGWRGTWALDGGGALMNQSIHTIDLLQWFIGPVTSVSGYAATLTHAIETEDTASAAVSLASGALGVIQGTTSGDHDRPVRVEIVGTAGRAVLENGRIAVWESDQSPRDDLLTAEDEEQCRGWRPDEPFGDAHARQLGAIFRALNDGATAPVPGDEARNAVDIILGIYESAHTGQRVDLTLQREALAHR
ncbi:MAG: Gfo/Idh/MocA family protein [Thermomicrobiales bacterium]